LNINEETTPTSAANTKAPRKRFSYRWIVVNIPFFLFLSFLAIVYIYNGHNADKTVRAINQVARQLKDMEYEFKILKGEVTFRSKQSELAKAVAPIGLEELVLPAKVLKDRTKENDK
jgi:hypothetical protein